MRDIFDGDSSTETERKKKSAEVVARRHALITEFPWVLRYIERSRISRVYVRRLDVDRLHAYPEYEDEKRAVGLYPQFVETLVYVADNGTEILKFPPWIRPSVAGASRWMFWRLYRIPSAYWALRLLPREEAARIRYLYSERLGFAYIHRVPKKYDDFWVWLKDAEAQERDRSEAAVSAQRRAISKEVSRIDHEAA